MNKILSTFLALALSLALAGAKPISLQSPDGRLTLEVDGLHYSLSYDGIPRIAHAQAGLELQGKAFDGRVRSSSVRRNVRESITAPLYRQAQFDYVYNSLTLRLRDGWSLEWRVSDEGAAYRFVYSGQEEITVVNERVEIPFCFDGQAWIPYASSAEKPYAISFESAYTVQRLSDGSPRPGFLPMLVAGEDGTKIALLESGLEAYPGLFIRSEGTTIRGEFAPYPKTYTHGGKDQYFVADTEEFIARSSGSRSYPWRILALADEDRDLPVNNLVYALAGPCRIGDTSWIRPGFSAWEWWNDWDLRGVDFPTGINNRTYEYYIDFAARNGLEYLVFDEGWYPSDSGDMLAVHPDLDLPRLVTYASERGVKLLLWCVFTSLDRHLEAYCRHYAEMGFAGFKVDFMDRNDQPAVEMIWRIAEAASRYGLILDYHGIFPPTGLCRSYPNVVNYEAIKGLENARWSSAEDFDMPLYDVTFPYIRQLAGYADYTPGAMRNAQRSDFAPNWRHSGSQGSRAHQVGLYIVTDAPLAMLCDAPTQYQKEQETTDFITSLPRSYDETRILCGQIGQYIVTARRAGDHWYIGGLSNWSARDLEIPLDFLSTGTHHARLFLDGINAEHNAEDYRIETRTISGEQTLKIHLCSGGGFAAIID